MAIRLIVGLGNPGEDYVHTRHNVGFMVLDAFAEAREASWQSTWQYKGRYDSLISETRDARDKIFLLKPQIFMNLSGRAVAAFAKDKGVGKGEIAVVHDDLDLPLGKVKAVYDRGAAGHNGVQSLIDHLGGKDFYRFRFGIGRPPEREEGAAYVLKGFKAPEKKQVDAAVRLVVDALGLALEKPWAEVVQWIGTHGDPAAP